MNPFYTFVADRAEHRCEYCRAPELVFNFPFEVEHIVPLSRGGEDSEVNLALACRSCNLRKGTRIDGYDPESANEVRFYNPRLDRWNEHFQVEIQTAIITGITPVGRVTVAFLEMNSQAQVMARQVWISISLFP